MPVRLKRFSRTVDRPLLTRLMTNKIDETKEWKKTKTKTNTRTNIEISLDHEISPEASRRDFIYLSVCFFFLKITNSGTRQRRKKINLDTKTISINERIRQRILLSRRPRSYSPANSPGIHYFPYRFKRLVVPRHQQQTRVFRDTLKMDINRGSK